MFINMNSLSQYACLCILIVTRDDDLLDVLFYYESNKN